MQMLLKILILITISLLGGLTFSIAVNIMIMTNIVDADTVQGGFGYLMTSKAVFIWILSVILGIISLFIKQKWRYFLLFSPLYAPIIFALLYALSQR